MLTSLLPSHCNAARSTRRSQLGVNSSPARRYIGTAEVPPLPDGIAAVPRTVSRATIRLVHRNKSRGQGIVLMSAIRVEHCLRRSHHLELLQILLDEWQPLLGPR